MVDSDVPRLDHRQGWRYCSRLFFSAPLFLISYTERKGKHSPLKGRALHNEAVSTGAGERFNFVGINRTSALVRISIY